MLLQVYETAGYLKSTEYSQIFLSGIVRRLLASASPQIRATAARGIAKEGTTACCSLVRPPAFLLMLQHVHDASDRRSSQGLRKIRGDLVAGSRDISSVLCSSEREERFSPWFFWRSARLVPVERLLWTCSADFARSLNVFLWENCRSLSASV